jgi:ABC-type hemin transport system substrate-binding protein
MTVVPLLKDNVFGPQDIQAMSTALEDVCNILDLPNEAKSDRELLAKKLVALAQQVPRDAALLRDRMLREIASGRREWPTSLVRAARQGAL